MSRTVTVAIGYDTIEPMRLEPGLGSTLVNLRARPHLPRPVNLRTRRRGASCSSPRRGRPSVRREWRLATSLPRCCQSRGRPHSPQSDSPQSKPARLLIELDPDAVALHDRAPRHLHLAVVLETEPRRASPPRCCRQSRSWRSPPSRARPPPGELAPLAHLDLRVHRRINNLLRRWSISLFSDRHLEVGVACDDPLSSAWSVESMIGDLAFVAPFTISGPLSLTAADRHLAVDADGHHRVGPVAVRCRSRPSRSVGCRSGSSPNVLATSGEQAGSQRDAHAEEDGDEREHRDRHRLTIAPSPHAGGGPRPSDGAEPRDEARGGGLATSGSIGMFALAELQSRRTPRRPAPLQRARRTTHSSRGAGPPSCPMVSAATGLRRGLPEPRRL